MLKIQKFLKEYSDPDMAILKAKEKFNLDVYEDSPGIVALNYSMIDSKRGIRESEECRGLILEKGTWNVVAFPFLRFYNSHEKPFVDEITSIANIVLTEKRDGTLCTMYYRDGWKVSTRKRPLADGNINGADSTFSELFFKTLKDNYGKQVEQNVSKDMNLIFELTGPENRIITPYDQPDLTLLAARKIDNEQHLYPEYNLEQLEMLSKKIGIKIPTIYKYAGIGNMIYQLENLETLDEGFVLADYSQDKDGSFARIKFKNPAYLGASRLLGSDFNGADALNLYLLGDSDEFISYFPEYRKLFEEVEFVFTEYSDFLDKIFKEHNVYSERKDFALAIQKDVRVDSEDYGVLFKMLTAGESTSLVFLAKYDNKRAAKNLFLRLKREWNML